MKSEIQVNVDYIETTAVSGSAIGEERDRDVMSLDPQSKIHKIL